jgi:hypothetical protein
MDARRIAAGRPLDPSQRRPDHIDRLRRRAPAVSPGKSQLNTNQAREALDAFLTSVTDTLKSGEEVRLVGFGSFMPVGCGRRGAGG